MENIVGGLGSGRRWHYGCSQTTDDYRVLDIRPINRDGLLIPGKSFRWQWLSRGQVLATIDIRIQTDRLILSYRARSVGKGWIEKCYPVDISWTACNFGGVRPWFRCPAIGCGRRCAILYGGTVFACRKCFALAYQSQRESLYDRKASRANKIRDQLGWEPGFLNGSGLRPKGMHRHTFDRLVAEHDTLVDSSLMNLHRRFRSIVQ